MLIPTARDLPCFSATPDRQFWNTHILCCRAHILCWSPCGSLLQTCSHPLKVKAKARQPKSLSRRRGAPEVLGVPGAQSCRTTAPRDIYICQPFGSDVLGHIPAQLIPQQKQCLFVAWKWTNLWLRNYLQMYILKDIKNKFKLNAPQNMLLMGIWALLDFPIKIFGKTS